MTKTIAAKPKPNPRKFTARNWKRGPLAKHSLTAGKVSSKQVTDPKPEPEK
jgi:hypothetical protein